jgi:hypothetical protein
MNEEQFASDLSALVQKLLGSLDGFDDDQAAALLSIALSTHLHHCLDLGITIRARDFLADSFTELFSGFESESQMMPESKSVH